MALEALGNVLSRIADRVRSRTDYENRKADQLADENRRENAVVRAEDRAEQRSIRTEGRQAEQAFQLWKRQSQEQQYLDAEKLGIENARSLTPGELGARVRSKLIENENENTRQGAISKYQTETEIRGMEAKDAENRVTDDIVANGGALLSMLSKTVENQRKIDEIAAKEPEFAGLLNTVITERQSSAKAAIDARLKEIDKTSGGGDAKAAALEGEVLSVGFQAMPVGLDRVKDPNKRAALLESVLRSNAILWAEKTNRIPTDDRGMMSAQIAQMRMMGGTDRDYLQSLLQEQSRIGTELLRRGITPGLPLEQQTFIPARAREHLLKIGSQQMLAPAGSATSPPAPTQAPAAVEAPSGPIIPPVVRPVASVQPSPAAAPTPPQGEIPLPSMSRLAGAYPAQGYAPRATFGTPAGAAPTGSPTPTSAVHSSYFAPPPAPVQAPLQPKSLASGWGGWMKDATASFFRGPSREEVSRKFPGVPFRQ